MKVDINSYSGGANPCGVGGEISVSTSREEIFGHYYRLDKVIEAIQNPHGDVAEYMLTMGAIV